MRQKINSEKDITDENKLPEGWRWVRLGDVCEIDSNQVLPNTDLTKQLPYIGLEHIEGGTGRIIDKINDPDGKLIQSITFRFDSRHVLYGKLRPYLNKVVTPDFEGRCTTELLPLLPKNDCDRYYLAWLLRRAETVEEAMRHKTGTRMPRTDIDELFKMFMPLPSLSEQKRIVAKLQELMHEVERARTACEKALDADKALPSAYLREVFESEEAKKWERKKLGDVCEHDSGVWGDDPDDSTECYFVLRSNNIREGKIVFDEIAIRKIKSKYLMSKALKSGDILVTTSSGSKDLLGKSAIFIPTDDKIYLFSNFTMRLRAKSEMLDYFYLHFYLQSPQAKNVLQLVQDTTTGLRNLDRKEFLNQLIPLPPLSKQHRIASYLKEKMAQIEKLRNAIERQLEAINTLPQAILRKAFRGEL